MDFVIARITLGDPISYRLVEGAMVVYGNDILPLFVAWKRRGKDIWQTFYGDCHGNLSRLIDQICSDLSEESKQISLPPRTLLNPLFRPPISLHRLEL